MEGLALVPDPLWWLLGAIVSFYFGARELHYQRARQSLRGRALRRITGTADGSAAPEARDAAEPPAARPAAQPAPVARSVAPKTAPTAPATQARPATVAVKAGDPTFNAALEEWRAARS